MLTQVNGQIASAQVLDTEAEARYEPAPRSSRDVIVKLAETYFRDDLVSWAIRTAQCESGFTLNAHSAGFDRRLGVYYDFRGPWQVDAVTWSVKAQELFGGDLSDPTISAQMANWIAVNYGRGHWPICGYR